MKKLVRIVVNIRPARLAHISTETRDEAGKRWADGWNSKHPIDLPKSFSSVSEIITWIKDTLGLEVPDGIWKYRIDGSNNPDEIHRIGLYAAGECME